MPTIVIKVDGVDITDRVVFSRSTFTSVADGNVGTCAITIDDLDQSYDTGDFITGQTIELLVDGTRAWDGWIFTVGRAWPMSYDDTTTPSNVPRYWNITGQDRNLLFQKRLLFKQSDPADNGGFRYWPEDTSDKVAIEYALANYVDLSGDGLSYNIENIASPGPFEEFYLAFVSAMLGTLFSDCSKMTGGVYFISPDRVLNYVSDITVTAPFSLSDAPTGAEVGYRELEAALDYSHAGNEALVWGAGKGSDDPVYAKYTNDAAVSTYGRWQWGELAIGAWKQQTVNRRARTYVIGSPSHRRGHDEPVPVVSCTIFEPGITAGMVVDFQSDVFSYQEPLPVRKSHITFPTPNSVKYDLELTLRVDEPFRGYDLMPPLPPWRFGPFPDPPPIGPIDPVPGGGFIDHFDQPGTAGVVDSIDTSDFDVSSTETNITYAYPWSSLDTEVGDLAVFYYVASVNDPAVSPGLGVDPDGLASGFSQVYSQGSTGEEWTQIGVRTIDGTETGDLEQIFLYTGSYTVYANCYLAIIRGGDITYELVDGLIERSYSESPSMELNAYHVLAASAPPTEATITATPTDGWSLGVNESDGTSALGIVQRSLPTTTSPAITGWAVTSGTPYVSRIGFFGTEASVFKTPGVGITGADPAVQIGGNEWEMWYGIDPNEIVMNQNSVARFIRDTYLGQYGHEFYVLYPIQGEWVDPELTNPVHPWGKTPFDYVVKFERESGVPLDSGATYGFFEANNHNQDIDPLAVSMWGSEQAVYVLWDDAAVSGQSHVYAYPTRDGGSGVAHAIYPDGLEVNEYIEGDGTPGTDWVQRKDPDWNWTYHRMIPAIEAGTSYLMRIQIGTDVLNAIANVKTFRVKLWKESESEPSGWLVDAVMGTYRSQVSTYLGYVNETGRVYYATTDDPVWFKVGPGPNDSAVLFDYIKTYAQYSGATTGGGVGIIVTDVPIYDGEASTLETSLFVTPYAYQPGSLVVYQGGIRLRAGIDYIETNAVAGEFRVLVSTGGGITTQYIRASTDPVPGASGVVYRPRGQLMYGWGTPLDGYNSLMAASAMALERHTEGAYTQFVGTPRGTPPNHRGFQDNQSDMGDVTDAATAWTNGWSQTLESVGNTSWADFSAKVGEGRGAILMGTYADMPSEKRFSASYDGPHTLYISERFSTGDYLGYDPMYLYPVIYTTAQLQSFAVGYPAAGLVRAAFTQVT